MIKPFVPSVLDAISNGVFILYFSNTDCAPCIMLEKILSQIDECDFYKINISEYLEIAQKFDVTSIPSIKIFKNGINISNIIGVRSEKDIRKILKHFNII